MYLRHYARACARAGPAVGGALEPLYRLHAARLELLLAPEPDVRSVAMYCFQKTTTKQVRAEQGGGHAEDIYGLFPTTCWSNRQLCSSERLCA